MPCQAWIVETGTGRQVLWLFAADCTFDHVFNAVECRYAPPFKIQRVDVGQFVLKEVEVSYSGDARKVNHNKEMVWEP